MIHNKPTTCMPMSSGAGNVYGQHGWLRLPIEQQPAVGKLVAAASSSRGGSGGSWWSGDTLGIANQEDSANKLDLSLKL